MPWFGQIHSIRRVLVIALQVSLYENYDVSLQSVIDGLDRNGEIVGRDLFLGGVSTIKRIQLRR